MQPRKLAHHNMCILTGGDDIHTCIAPCYLFQMKKAQAYTRHCPNTKHNNSNTNMAQYKTNSNNNQTLKNYNKNVYKQRDEMQNGSQFPGTWFQTKQTCTKKE